ncbi:MAG: DNA polymerase III subunit delta' [Candidatus Omnitrophica bacterium]|nr:DNA polymerase III subunit delta' [Candidatus Omnitrophota bacterium]
MSFQSIKGQDRPIAILRGALRLGQLSGSYLFCGDEGIGKYLAALTLAKAVNCLDQKDDSCDSCPSCLKIEKSQHPDVHSICRENTEAIKIEQVRRLKKEISLRPYEARRKVFIINEAHLMTQDASNALLKTLEEPAAHSLIILVSSKPALLLKTIASRCKAVRFYPMSRGRLEEFLRNDYRLSTDFAHFLAYFSEGRIGRALRLKEGDILREKNSVIDKFIVSVKRGNTDNFTFKEREGVRDSLNILASWFRDIYLLKAGMPHSGLINIDRKEDLLRFMGRYSCLDVEESLNSISQALLYLEENINVKLLMSNLRIQPWKG